MASRTLTTTSYAILGLLAVKPWSTYELTQQMERSLGHMWPRAQSKLYEEPKKLVEHGLARVTGEKVGRRGRNVYRITAKGRRALAKWLESPGSGPSLEFEQLLKVFFADGGTRTDTMRTLAAAREWSATMSEATAAVGRLYAEGAGEFPERSAQHAVTVRFLIDFYALVGEWARWAAEEVDDWPEDPSLATVDPELVLENLRRAEDAAATARPTSPRPAP